MKKKDFIFFGVCTALAVLFISTADIKTPGEYYALHPAEISEDGAYVKLTIDCSSVAKKDKALPDDGTMLTGSYALASGESVYDITARVLHYENIPFDVSGGKAVYIDGIGGLYELDYGAESGWIYTVNGTAPDINCGEYKPLSGDEIEFIYVDSYYKGVGR